VASAHNGHSIEQKQHEEQKEDDEY
jgi:hypothetical protein